MPPSDTCGFILHALIVVTVSAVVLGNFHFTHSLFEGVFVSTDKIFCFEVIGLLPSLSICELILKALFGLLMVTPLIYYVLNSQRVSPYDSLDILYDDCTAEISITNFPNQPPTVKSR